MGQYFLYRDGIEDRHSALHEMKTKKPAKGKKVTGIRILLSFPVTRHRSRVTALFWNRVDGCRRPGIIKSHKIPRNVVLCRSVNERSVLIL